jgi:4'-phosphopantetheinyl transferase
MTIKTSIIIIYAQYNHSLENFQWIKKFEKLPDVIKTKCNRYVRWQDKQSCVLGKLLLQEGLWQLGISNDQVLTGWYTDELGKPRVGGDIRFNISHTEGFVVCAVLSGTVRVGIDIEKVKPINLDDFTLALGETVIKEIALSPDPYESFYRYWTATESALKADGRGFLVDLGQVQIELNSNKVTIDRTVWHLSPICLAPDVVCYLATSSRDVHLDLQRSVIL